MIQRLKMRTVMLSIFLLIFGYAKQEISSLSFAPVELATTDQEKRSMRVSNSVKVSYDDNSSKEYPLSFQTFATMGEKIGSGTMGLMVDVEGQAIRAKDGSIDISDGPDGNSFVKVGDDYYLITHMEETPGLLYQTKIKLQNNTLKAVDTKAIDLSTIDGTLINCASTKTPYGSHLGGEEDYSLNSRYADTVSPYYKDCDNLKAGDDAGVHFCNYVDGMRKYLKDSRIEKQKGYNGGRFSPYNYGYIVEVQPQRYGSTKVAKHFVTGKYTPELAAMMPDQKTLYMSDDGTYKGLWKFVSDKKIEDFTPNWQGRLYAAKLTQTSAQNGGTFDLSWIELGDASDREIEALVKRKMKLSDIFEIGMLRDGVCNKGFKKILEDDLPLCLKLKKGQEKAAAFLESRKYAAYLGATMEFLKEEGLTHNPDTNELYIAISQIKKSMEDNYNNEETNNDIRLPKNQCGGVYAMELDSHYSAKRMRALLTGRKLKEGEKHADSYACSPEGISNPDNITYIGDDTLIISEDTSYHLNNFSWAFNTKTKQLTRIASLPIGAEVTGVERAVVDERGFLFINIQHPFKDNPANAKGEHPHSYLIEKATSEELKAKIGIINGFPTQISQSQK